MPETHDLDESLRALATDLDARSRPTTAADAMSRATRARRPRARPPRWALVVLAASAVVAVVAVTAGLPGGGKRDNVTTDRTPGTTPPPTLPDVPTSGTITRRSNALDGTPLAALPESGFADVTDDGVVLLSYDGTELARAGGWPGGAPAPGADLVVRDDRGSTIVETAPPDPAQVPEGECSEAAGAGGSRVAICEGRTELDRVEPDGTRTRLTGIVAGTTWTRVLPSPDGRWVLAELTAGCGKPLAVVHATRPGGSTQSPFLDAERVAVGWLPDGRAVMQVLGEGCEGRGAEPSVEALGPGGGGVAMLPISPRGVLHRWTRDDGGLNDDDRTFQRAARELGLERCCDGPLAGANVNSGVVWDGTRVSVATSDQATWPPDYPEMHTVSVDGVDIVVAEGAGGAVATFLCKNIWVIGGEPRDVTDEATVVAVAEALIPHLYCTVGPPASG
jgi:hypothetical protein